MRTDNSDERCWIAVDVPNQRQRLDRRSRRGCVRDGILRLHVAEIGGWNGACSIRGVLCELAGIFESFLSHDKNRLVLQIAVAGFDVWKVSLISFVIAWIGQFIGHSSLFEGKKPSFFKVSMLVGLFDCNVVTPTT
jgi:hypothetical protein